MNPNKQQAKVFLAAYFEGMRQDRILYRNWKEGLAFMLEAELKPKERESLILSLTEEDIDFVADDTKEDERPTTLTFLKQSKSGTMIFELSFATICDKKRCLCKCSLASSIL